MDYYLQNQKKINPNITKNLIYELSLIPFKYKGNMQLYDTIIEELKKKYPDHTNFIINYFNENKREYFEDLSFDYSKIPQNTHANSILERYNGTIKEYLGEEEHECTLHSGK